MAAHPRGATGSIAFVHDEVLIELPDEGGYVSKAMVDRIIGILRSEMQSVLGGDLPVECESALSTCWSKDAKLIERTARSIPGGPKRRGSSEMGQSDGIGEAIIPTTKKRAILAFPTCRLALNLVYGLPIISMDEARSSSGGSLSSSAQGRGIVMK